MHIAFRADSSLIIGTGHLMRCLTLAEEFAGHGVEPYFPAHIGARSQDLEEAFHDAGQFYWGRATAFLKDRPVFSERTIPVVLPRYLVQDIDTEEDWRRAEIMWTAIQGQGDD